MSYYKKESLRKFVDQQIEEIEALRISEGEKAFQLLNQPSDFFSSLENNSDLIHFFWIKTNDNGSSIAPEMKGKTFVKITPEIYSDDPYAVDLYKSTRDGVSIEQIIKEREIN